MLKIFFTFNQDHFQLVWAESAGLTAVMSKSVIFACATDKADLMDLVKKQIQPHLSEVEATAFMSKLKRAIELAKKIDPIRTEIQKVRLTKQEKATLEERAGMMSASAYLRACAIYSPPISIPPINAETLTELRRIGTNLNQLARHSNETMRPNIDAATTEIAALRLTLMSAQK